MTERVKSLAKAMSVLELLGEYPNGLSLQSIAEQTGASKSSTHRILATFEDTGFVRQVATNKEYRLTMKLLQIGQSAVNSDVIGIAKPYLLSLVEKLNETVNFLSFDNDNIIFKDKLEPAMTSFRTRTYVGYHSPMYCSAAGKAFLAFSSDQIRQSYWQRNASTMKKLTENTILGKDNFFKALDECRERGFAIDVEENEVGISCVAVPIRDKTGQPVYAISVSTLTPKMHAKGYASFALDIQEMSKQLEKKLF